MRIYLAASGWVTEAPIGNRLRWHYPATELVGGRPLGFPRRIIVERAPLDGRIENVDRVAPPPGSMLVPGDWWSLPSTVTPNPWDGRVPLNGVQAVRFVYNGAPALVRALDGDRRRVAFEQVISGSAPMPIVIEGADLRELQILTFGYVTLQNLQVLDLFADRGLAWEQIAEIRVRDTFTADWADVALRHPAPRMTAAEWDHLVALADQATSMVPAMKIASLAPPDELNAILGVRWEHALLAGSGWFDGPRTQSSPLDEIGAAFDTRPGVATAYRVVDPDGRLPLPVSNVAVVPATDLSRLLAPAAPTYERLQAQLWPPREPGAPGPQDYLATYDLHWETTDPRTAGVIVMEELSDSAVLGEPGRRLTFEHRRARSEAPMSGLLPRRVPVTFVDVTFSATALAIDAWDRESDPSPMTGPLTPALHHTPTPPPLESGSRDGATVTLRIKGPEPGGPGPQHAWAPDPIVRHANGRVLVLRRRYPVTPLDIEIDHGLNADGGVHQLVTVLDPPGFPAAGYVGEWLFVGGRRFRVEGSGGVGGTALLVRAGSDGPGQPPVIPAGRAAIQPNTDASSPVWEEVTSFGAEGLPAELVFDDPLADPSRTTVSTYALCVETHLTVTRRGPVSNQVAVQWLPPVPEPPPPFVVTPLGRDFYDRTMLRIVLTQAVAAGTYTLWWAPGHLAQAAFQRVATPGLLKAQPAEGGTVLYDVQALPVPKPGDEQPITYGLQRLNGAHAQSTFTLVATTIRSP